jgi:hypothetical protein
MIFWDKLVALFACKQGGNAVFRIKGLLIGVFSEKMENK